MCDAWANVIVCAIGFDDRTVHFHFFLRKYSIGQSAAKQCIHFRLRMGISMTDSTVSKLQLTFGKNSTKRTHRERIVLATGLSNWRMLERRFEVPTSAYLRLNDTLEHSKYLNYASFLPTRRARFHWPSSNLDVYESVDVDSSVLHAEIQLLYASRRNRWQIVAFGPWI